MKRMTARQLPLGFTSPAAMGEGDFIPAETNKEALAWVNRWPEWPAHGLILIGPAGSGKTHLAHIWSARAKAAFATSLDLPAEPRLVLEDADRWITGPNCEEKLFHLLNHIAANKGYLLITASDVPSQWAVKLPDLRSRLLALPATHIEAPDDATLIALMGKLFSDRQLQVNAEVLDYLVRRIERSYSAAAGVVVALDAASLATNRAVTLPLAREVLARMDEMPT